MGELLFGSNSWRLQNTFSDESRSKVDNRRSMVPRDKFGKLNVEFWSADEACSDEGSRNWDVELALIFGVDEPRGDFLCDLDEETAKSFEEEDVDLSSECCLASVKKLDDLLRASQSGFVATDRASSNERDLLNDLSNLAFRRKAGQGSNRFRRETLFEIADEGLFFGEVKASACNAICKRETFMEIKNPQQTSP